MTRPKPTAQPCECDLEWLKTTNQAAITRPQTAQVLGVDERTVARAIDAGELPSLQIGRRVLVPRLPLLRLLGADTASEAAR